MRAGERETICHCWVILRSREQGLLSLFETHIHVLSLLVPDTHPDTYLHIPAHTEATQLEERPKVTEFYRYTGKLKESDTGATNSDKYVVPLH